MERGNSYFISIFVLIYIFNLKTLSCRKNFTHTLKCNIAPNPPFPREYTLVHDSVYRVLYTWCA